MAVSKFIAVKSKSTIPVAQTYAAQWNARYNHSGADYVDLNKRFNNSVSSVPVLKQTGIRSNISNAINEFQKRYPTYTKFQDLQLVQPGYVPLSDILIDVTIQRVLDLTWVHEILKNFREVQAQPIQVYEVMEGNDEVGYVPTGKKLYASWDAQHTAIVYWIIAVMIYKQDPTTVMVPVNIYKITNRADIRKNFVSGNSEEGKKLLDKIDLFTQMIFGVRLDNATDKDWMEADAKQQHLEDGDLFVTAEKFGNTNQPGAISRMQEIDRYTSDVIRKFVLYTTTIPAGRPIDSQEIEIMCAFFDMAKNAGIDYTDAEIVDLGNHLNSLFGANFHESSPFWNQVRTAYNNWWNDFYKKIPKSHRPKNTKMAKNWNSGGTFLWHQLNKSWTGHQLPPLSSSTPFIPDAKDLY
jgi:heat shock protein HspQ